MSMSFHPFFLPAWLFLFHRRLVRFRSPVERREPNRTSYPRKKRKHYSHSFPFVKFSLIASLHQGTRNEMLTTAQKQMARKGLEQCSSNKQATIKSNVRQRKGNCLYFQPVSYYMSHSFTFLLAPMHVHVLNLGHSLHVGSDVLLAIASLLSQTLTGKKN